MQYVENEFVFPNSIVAHLQKQFFITKSATRKYNSDRPHKTTSQEERFITVTPKRNCYLIAGQKQ